MIGLGSQGNIEHNLFIALFCSAVILSYPLSFMNHYIFNHLSSSSGMHWKPCKWFWILASPPWNSEASPANVSKVVLITEPGVNHFTTLMMVITEILEMLKGDKFCSIKKTSAQLRKLLLTRTTTFTFSPPWLSSIFSQDACDKNLAGAPVRYSVVPKWSRNIPKKVPNPKSWIRSTDGMQEGLPVDTPLSNSAAAASSAASAGSLQIVCCCSGTSLSFAPTLVLW